MRTYDRRKNLICIVFFLSKEFNFLIKKRSLVLVYKLIIFYDTLKVVGGVRALSISTVHNIHTIF